MKGQIIKPQKEKNYNLLTSIIFLILGIVLVTNSNQIVTVAFQIIGIGIVLFGLYKTFQYLNLKKQFKTEDNEALMAGIMGITIGLLTILLASILEVGLRYILGIYLLINGINKINIALEFKMINKKLFITYLIEGIIIILLGLYTIFFANAALMIVGILLIISSILDFITNFQAKK